MTKAAPADSVTVARDSGVATVTVDKPPVNSLDDATLAGLGAAARSIGADPEVRAVVLTGAGSKTFMAGADLAEIRGALGVPGGMEEHVALTVPTFDAWRRLPQPVVAAVTAHAVGGGLEFALLCDLIVAEPRCRFGLPEVTLGLIPGGGGTQRLPRRIPAALAAELVLLGGMIDAERARRSGLVNEVVGEGEALARAQEIAARLAALPALAVQAAKRALRAPVDAGLDAGLDLERELFLEVCASADAREGAEAFLAKRRARFRHR
jgi:enoyl-CoA hydratase/carnithine racemase